MPSGDLDLRVRFAAFDFLGEQMRVHGDVLPARILREGFTFENGGCSSSGPKASSCGDPARDASLDPDGARELSFSPQSCGSFVSRYSGMYRVDRTWDGRRAHHLPLTG